MRTFRIRKVSFQMRISTGPHLAQPASNGGSKAKFASIVIVRCDFDN